MISNAIRSAITVFFAFLLTLHTTDLLSQEIYFPKEIYSDSLELLAKIEEVSSDLLKEMDEVGDANHHRTLFQLKILAGDYHGAQASIDTYLNKSTIKRWREYTVLLDECYARAMTIVENENISFESAYQNSFEKIYQGINEKLTPGIQFMIDDMNTDDWSETVEKYNNNDTISTSDAKSLCQAYYRYILSSTAKELSQELLDKKNKETLMIEEDVVISLPNGKSVTALIVRKKNNKKPLPTIFVYNIYAGSYDMVVAKRAALHDYVGISVNTRGKRLSSDEIVPFEYDGEDASHIIEWISNQTWSDGQVGMMGGSYLGFSQWSALKNPHPALKTIVPQVAVGIGTMDYPMENHVFMTYALRWIKFVTNDRFTDDDSFSDGAKWNSVDSAWYTSGMSFRSLDSIEGGKDKIFQRWLDHPSHDEFWQNMVPYGVEFGSINIPILTTTGYFDADQNGALYYFKEHHKHNPKAEHYLVIGPYSHGGGQHFASKKVGNYMIDSVANISMHKLAYEWFDYTMKGAPKPSLLKNKVNYQVMDANEWRHATSISKINKESFRFYLTSKRKNDHYKLETDLTDGDRAFIFHEVDLGDRSNESGTYNSAYPFIPEEIDHGNGLRFISDTLKDDYIFTGTLTGELNFTINKKDMDVIIELYEVLPNGTYFQLSSYLARASYAKDRTKRQLIIPNKRTSIPIHNNLNPILKYCYLVCIDRFVFNRWLFGEE